MGLLYKYNFSWLAILFIVRSPIFVQSNDVAESVKSEQDIIMACEVDLDSNAIKNYEATLNSTKPYVSSGPEVIGYIRRSCSSYVWGIGAIYDWCDMAIPELERSKRTSNVQEKKEILKDVLLKGVVQADLSKFYLQDSTFFINVAIVSLDNIKASLSSVKRNLERDTQSQIDKIRRNEDIPEFVMHIPIINGIVAGANQIANELTRVSELKLYLELETKIITNIINDLTSLSRRNLDIKTKLESAILSATDVGAKTEAASILLIREITVNHAVKKLIEMIYSFKIKYKPQIDRYKEVKENIRKFKAKHRLP